MTVKHHTTMAVAHPRSHPLHRNTISKPILDPTLTRARPRQPRGPPRTKILAGVTLHGPDHLDAIIRAAKIEPKGWEETRLGLPANSHTNWEPFGVQVKAFMSTMVRYSVAALNSSVFDVLPLSPEEDYNRPFDENSFWKEFGWAWRSSLKRETVEERRDLFAYESEEEGNDESGYESEDDAVESEAGAAEDLGDLVKKG